jgi:hypothetical protein
VDVHACGVLFRPTRSTVCLDVSLDKGSRGGDCSPFSLERGRWESGTLDTRSRSGGRLSRKKVKKRMRKLNEGQTNIKITQIAAAQHELNPQGMPDSHRLLFYIEPITERQTRVGQSPATITTRLFSYRSDAPSTYSVWAARSLPMQVLYPICQRHAGAVPPPAGTNQDGMATSHGSVGLLCVGPKRAVGPPLSKSHHNRQPESRERSIAGCDCPVEESSSRLKFGVRGETARSVSRRAPFFHPGHNGLIHIHGQGTADREPQASRLSRG